MQYLTLDEVKAVISLAEPVRLKRSSKRQIVPLTRDRLRLALKVTFWHGLRATEICELTAANIQDGYLTIQRLKGSEETCQKFRVHPDPMLDEAQELRKLAAELKPTERLFPGWDRFQFYYVFGKAGRKAGLPKPKRHPHCLKHSTAMFAKSAGINVVRAVLGHKAGSSSLEYMKINDSAADMEMDKLLGAM